MKPIRLPLLLLALVLSVQAGTNDPTSPQTEVEGGPMQPLAGSLQRIGMFPANRSLVRP